MNLESNIYLTSTCRAFCKSQYVDNIFSLFSYDFILCHTVLQSASNAWRTRWTARERNPTTQVRDARLAAEAKPAAGMKSSQVTIHSDAWPSPALPQHTHTDTHTFTLSHTAGDGPGVFVRPVVRAGFGSAGIISVFCPFWWNSGRGFVYYTL